MPAAFVRSANMSNPIQGAVEIIPVSPIVMCESGDNIVIGHWYLTDLHSSLIGSIILRRLESATAP